MYLEFFGLNRTPFKITPDTHLFYEGSNRGDNLLGLCYTVAHAEGISKVVGEVGTGKTMLSRMLPLKVEEHIDWVYLPHPNLSPSEVLVAIARELGLEVDDGADKSLLNTRLHQALISRHAKGRRVVVLIDEVQAMSIETLEEIRLLSNLETDEHKLLQIVMFGQPEIDKKLAMPEIRQLRERIVHHFYLSPFTERDVQEYLNFRMRASGYKGPDIFTQGVAKAIMAYSQGLVRRVNIIADKTLLAAYVNNRYELKVEDVKAAAVEGRFKAVPLWQRVKSLVSKRDYALVVLIGIASGSTGLNVEGLL